MACLNTILQEIDYDLCALTGDYRGQAFGPYEATLAGMSRICAKLKQPIYGVLGNHDTVRMVPGLEQMGIRMLLNVRPSSVIGNCNAYTWHRRCAFLSCGQH
jgi:uncharacterized protein